MLLVQLKSAKVSSGKATLRTSPSSGQAAISALLSLHTHCLPLRGSVRRLGWAFDVTMREGFDNGSAHG